MGFCVKYALRQSFFVSKIPPVQAKNQIITVSVFLSTLQQTAYSPKVSASASVVTPYDTGWGGYD